MELKEFFLKHPEVAIAFSGGVDSCYLLYAAKLYAKSFRAYYVKSVFQPQFEMEDARRFAKEIGAPLTELSVDILSDSLVAANPPDRCYHCKQKLFREIINNARKDGFSVILDGTNASDDFSDRPGMKALQELQILSPLRECSLTKSKIRELSKEAGLFTWNKPSYACLATRRPYGNKITKAALECTERSEAFLTSLGFSDFRVRTLVLSDGSEGANIEVLENQLEKLLQNREKIIKELKKYYSKLFINLEVRGEQ